MPERVDVCALVTSDAEDRSNGAIGGLSVRRGQRAGFPQNQTMIEREQLHAHDGGRR